MLARTATAVLRQQGATVRLIDMSVGGVVQGSADQVLVFCYPVYGWGMPRLVARFINSLPVSNQRAVLIATMGGEHPGVALAHARKILSVKGCTVIGARAFTLPNNYPMGRVPKDSERLLAAAVGDVREFANRVNKEKLLAPEVSLPAYVFSRLANMGFWATLGLSARGFRVTDKCNGCEYCRRVCPAANIVIEGKLPVWGRKCEQCLRCVQLCPRAAVEFMGLREGGRPRYREPSLNPNDFIIRP